MPETIDKPATYADIEALPPNVVGEILYDRLVQHPRPGPKHVHVSSSLGDELVGPFQKGRGGPGGWRIYDEPELHLGGHIPVSYTHLRAHETYEGISYGVLLM